MEKGKMSLEDFGRELNELNDKLDSLLHLDGVISSTCLYGALVSASYALSLGCMHSYEFIDGYE